MLFQAPKETRRQFLFSILGPLQSQITILQNFTSLSSWRNSCAWGTSYAGQNFASAHPLPFERLPRKLHNQFFFILSIFHFGCISNQPRPQGAFPWLQGRGPQSQGKAPWGRGCISNIFLATLFCHIKSGRQTGQIAIIGFRNVIFSDLSRTQHQLKRKRCPLNVLFSHYNPSKQSY